MWRPEVGLRSPGAGVTGSFEPSHLIQVLETELWISEYMLLTPEPSLQTLSFYFFFHRHLPDLWDFFCLLFLFLIFSSGQLLWMLILTWVYRFETKTTMGNNETLPRANKKKKYWRDSLIGERTLLACTGPAQLNKILVKTKFWVPYSVVYDSGKRYCMSERWGEMGGKKDLNWLWTCLWNNIYPYIFSY